MQLHLLIIVPICHYAFQQSILVSASIEWISIFSGNTKLDISMLAVLMIVMIFTILKSAHFKTMEYTLLMYWPLTIHNITYYAHVTKDEGKNV